MIRSSQPMSGMNGGADILLGAIIIIAAKIAVTNELFFINNPKSKVQKYKICRKIRIFAKKIFKVITRKW